MGRKPTISYGFFSTLSDADKQLGFMRKNGYINFLAVATCDLLAADVELVFQALMGASEVRTVAMKLDRLVETYDRFAIFRYHSPTSNPNQKRSLWTGLLVCCKSGDDLAAAEHFVSQRC